jgi:hypothetical protein
MTPSMPISGTNIATGSQCIQEKSMKEKTARGQLQAKIDRVHGARIMVERFIDAGGDLHSKQAVPIGRELSLAANDLVAEFPPSTPKDPA